MRTQGTFQDVYRAARDLLEDATDCPLNPVIRLEGEVWMLESDLEPAEDATLEISLDDFQSYWFEEMHDPDFTPEEAEVEGYLRLLREDQRED